MPPPVHPKMASSSATVAPLLAALVAPTLRTPCADLRIPAARQALEKALPNASLVKPFLRGNGRRKPHNDGIDAHLYRCRPSLFCRADGAGNVGLS